MRLLVNTERDQAIDRVSLAIQLQLNETGPVSRLVKQLAAAAVSFCAAIPCTHRHKCRSPHRPLAGPQVYQSGAHGRIVPVTYKMTILIGGVEYIWDGCQWLQIVKSDSSSWVGSKPYCDGCSMTGTCACPEHVLAVDQNTRLYLGFVQPNRYRTEPT